jgi:hypothetical protein
MAKAMTKSEIAAHLAVKISDNVGVDESEPGQIKAGTRPSVSRIEQVANLVDPRLQQLALQLDAGGRAVLIRPCDSQHALLFSFCRGRER